MFYILYNGPINAAGCRSVTISCLQAREQKEPDVTLILSSGGGDVEPGMGLFHFLKMMFPEMKVNTHAAGACSSVAAAIFLAGTRRTASSITGFNLHAASTNGLISPTTRLTSAPFIRECGWNEERVSHYFSSTDAKYISVDEALTMGIIHEIRELKLTKSDSIVTVAF
jgi:ATP-dependent protease ClpP protease subunit